MLPFSWCLITAPVMVLSLLFTLGCGEANDSAAATQDVPQPAQAEGAPPEPKAETNETNETNEPAMPPSAHPENTAADALSAAAARHSFSWLGQEEGAALAAAAAAHQAMRVVRRDGEDLPTTRDLRPGRLNLHVHGGRVTAVLREMDGGGDELFEGVSALDLLPFIGLAEAASEAAATTAKRPWRIIRRDGEGYMVTMDYREERVNAIVVEGVVTAASDG